MERGGLEKKSARPASTITAFAEEPTSKKPLKGNPVSRLTSSIVFASAAILANHADALTPSCPSVTSPPGVVRAIVEGRHSTVGQVAITYSIAERSVCAAFSANPKVAKTIQPETVCYDVSAYGRLTQRGDAVATATMLDGGQRELRLDREAELEMSAVYITYADNCLGRRPDAAKPML
jgi:hypothetical protein